MNRPIPMSQQSLIATLTDMLDRVKVGDSLEGSLEYALPYIGDPEDAYAMVRASYRVGNLQGQGGMRMVGEMTDDPDPQAVRAEALRAQVRELVTAGVRNAEIHRRSAMPLLEAAGFTADAARQITYAAEEET